MPGRRPTVTPPDERAQVVAESRPTDTPVPPLEERLVELPYHRLLRAQPTYRWWRPLLAILLLAVFVLLTSFIVVGVGAGIGVLIGEIRTDTAANLEADLLALAVIDAGSPFHLTVALLSVVVWLPCVPLALLCAGIRPAGFATNVLNSVTFRLRGRWLATLLLPATVVSLAATVVSVGAGIAFGEALVAPTITPTIVLSIALILLIVPFQAAAEEYVFRGVLMQAIGSWVRWLPLALVIPTLVFVAGHIYDVWGLLDVGVFGLAAAVLTWRTGGLEAAIVMHALNNIVAFLVLASGILGTTAVTAEGGSPLGVGITVVTMSGYLLWVERLARRRGVERMSRIRVTVPVGTPAAT